MRDADLYDALAAADPARDLADERPPEDVLAAILRTPREDPPPAPRRRLPRAALAAALATAAAAVALAVLPSDDDRGSAAARALNDVAGIAEAKAAPAPQRGVAYSVIETASLGTNGDPPPFSVLLPSRIERWARPDGSGRVIATDRPPVFPGDRDRRRWIAAGRPDLGEVTRSDKRFGPGELNDVADPGLPPSRDLPTEPGALEDALRRVADQHSAPDVKVFELAARVLAQANPSPELRAALYRLLAGLDGVEKLDRTRDPRGRPAAAVAVESDYSGQPTRTVLYFDPETAEPLGHTEELLVEVMYTDGPVQGYEIVVARGVVDAVGERP
jgi:hypothetical protein